jgi:hypothetical protein
MSTLLTCVSAHTGPLCPAIVPLHFNRCNPCTIAGSGSINVESRGKERENVSTKL